MRRFTDYVLLDQKVCQLASSIETNLLVYTNPQNLSVEKKKFFEALEKKEVYNPSFTYVPRNPLYSYFTLSPSFDTYRNELKELIRRSGRDPLGIIFERKILDLFDRMEMIRSVGTENFSSNSEGYYGTIEPRTLNLAKELLAKEHTTEEKTINFEKAKELVTAFLKKKRLPYKVVPKVTHGSKFSVNVRTKEIMINDSIMLSPGSIKRLISHEIEGHIYRYENGLRQPYTIFSRGLSKETLETEEGLAVVIEQMQGINVDPQLREYAGRVLAVDIASKKSFFDTFTKLTEYFGKEEAFNITLRAKRGVFRQDTGGAFSKDILYLQGLLVVQDYLKNAKIEDLYFGRYSVFDSQLVAQVDGLKAPKFLPECVSKKS